METEALSLRISFEKNHPHWITGAFHAFYNEPLLFREDLVEVFSGTYLRLA